MPNSQEKRGKGSYLREHRERKKDKKTVLLGELYRPRLQRQNKLDTDADRMNQRMRRSPMIRTDCQSQLEAKQSKKSKAT